jgi:hypothetical protein
MPTREVLEALGNGYFEEFSPGVAVDQAQLLTFKGTADIDIGFFKGVLETMNTSQLEPDVREIKKYEPGVGHGRGRGTERRMASSGPRAALGHQAAEGRRHWTRAVQGSVRS